MIEKEKNFISAVIYIRDCEDTIADFLISLNEQLQLHFEKYEIICVDDCSDDNSNIKLRETAAKMQIDGTLSIIKMGYYQGLENAMNAGVDLAIGDFVFEFDNSIMSYSPEMVIMAYRHSLQGFDIVSVGSSNGGRLSSKLFYTVFNRFSNFQYPLSTEDFRLLSRRAINRIHAMSKTIPYRKALYANCGLKTDRLFYDSSVCSTASKSNIRPDRREQYRTAFDSLILFTNFAYKVTMTMATAMMAITLGGLIYVLVVYILGRPVPGYTTSMLVITGGFFAVFTLLAVIMKYLSVLVDLVFKRQQYIVESIEKVTTEFAPKKER